MTTSTSSSSRSDEVPVSTFQEDFISAESFRSADRNRVVSGHFRLAIFAVSWDRRCLSLAKATSWSAERAIVILPSIRDNNGLFAENQTRLLSLLEERGIAAELIDGAEESVGFDGIWDRLYDIAVQEGNSGITPLPFLLDLSAMSRYYSTGMIAMVIRLGLAGQFDCFYAEGKYDAVQDVKDVVFSGGGWERRTIPFLDGCGNPSLGWYYVVAAGFDGMWIKKILLQEEPDRIGLLIPIPGVSPSYEKRCLDEVQPIANEFMVPKEFQTSAHAGDAVEAWKRLSALDHEKWDEEQVAYLACGTKPHALAMALRALIHRLPAVLYFKPERYTVTIVEEAGFFWRYSIKDHSSASRLGR